MFRYLIIFSFVTISGCVSSGEDYDAARKVGKYLDTAGVVPLNSRLADETHSGKIVYFSPGVNFSPHFTYYEVTSKSDIKKLKEAAEDAIKDIPEVKKITLHFIEKQVIKTEGNFISRGRQNEIETIVVKK